MELLDVKFASLASAVVIANLLPDSLSDFVGRGLSGPPEIPRYFKADELFRHVHIASHEIERIVKVPDSSALQVWLLGVNANVKNHSRSSHALCVKHSQPVGRSAQKAKLVHQPLCVQGPTLAVSRGPGCEPAPVVESLFDVGLLGHLQVVTGDTLVINGRSLAPGVKLFNTLGNRPPHPS